MSVENQQTLEVYEKYADIYAEGSKRRLEHEPERIIKKRENLKKWIQTALDGLPKDARLFEFGSGEGDDVALFEELGYQITPSDAPESFVKIMRKKGLNPTVFNVLSDDFPGQYDGIYSLRVLVHFTKEDAAKALKKVFQALKPGGRYIFNALNSAGHNNLSEEWKDFSGDYAMGVKRYFKYWNEDELATLLEQTGFKIRSMFPDGGDSGQEWFYVVVEKPEENK